MRSLAITISLVVAGCGPNAEQAEVAAMDEKADVQAPPSVQQPASVAMSEADMGRACRGAIASINGRDPGIIKVTRTAGNLIRTRYTRDDGTVWQNECEVGSGNLRWRTWDGNGPGSGPGRWRTEDEILFTITGDKVHVRQSMEGELISEDDFTIP